MTFGRSRPVRPELSRASWRRTREAVKRRDHYRCQVCGSMRFLKVGHRTPPERYAGSHDDPMNLVTLCAACNSSQGNRTLAEWAAAGTGRLVELGLVDAVVALTGMSAALRKTPTTTITRDYTRRTIFDKPAPPPRVW